MHALDLDKGGDQIIPLVTFSWVVAVHYGEGRSHWPAFAFQRAGIIKC
jgi:hypothetical protein